MIVGPVADEVGTRYIGGDVDQAAAERADASPRGRPFWCGGAGRARGGFTVAGVTDVASARFVWRQGEVPRDVPVAQVYGWLFDELGRVLVQQTDRGWNLPGGSPERFDADPCATVRREAREESQVRVGELVYLGYEETLRGDAVCALVRMAGRIEAFEPRQPDPDGGRLLGRWMVRLEQACELLGWGDSGRKQAIAAGELARSRWSIPADSQSAVAQHID